MAMGKGYRIFHKVPPDRETPYSVIMDSKAKEESLMFESNAIVSLAAGEATELKKQYTRVMDAYGCLGALSFHAGNQRLLYLVMVTSCLSVGKVGESEVFRITAVQLHSLRNDPGDEERVSEVRKLLSSGVFYFSWSLSGSNWDLSLCAQRKLQDQESDNRFFWNRMLHVHFQRYGLDCSQWLLKVMCGAVEIRTIYAAHRQAKACLISRLSCERAGTRFNVRGTNDDGHVANFVETEQVIFLEEQVCSFIQTRGSIPLFWEQTGIQVGSHKVHMSRGVEASAPAYDRHLRMIRKQYGDQVLVNLLGSKEGERLLSQHFENHHKASAHAQDVPYIHFDYHSEIKGSNLQNLDRLKSKLIKHIKKFEFFYAEGSNLKKQQMGTVRTNCLDCLDRTNAVQTMIAMEVLPLQLECLGLAGKPQMLSRFVEVYKQIWGLNGDHISRIYAGTGALGGGRPKALDAARSANRAIQNNFLDGSKQEAFDILLIGSSLQGELADKARALLTTRSLHAAPSILQPMIMRYKEYSGTTKVRIGVGTWNVNGGKHFRSVAYKDHTIADWLLDAPKNLISTNPGLLSPDVDYNQPVDIYAVGFEEIVDLNASNIMKASTTNCRDWQRELLKEICRDQKYAILTHIQLVGVVLFIFVRPHLAPFIRDVAVERVKTGLGGTTGNKGGVAVRFLVHSTSVCFVCAHLAAGQSQVNDRNADYIEINKKLFFPMGRAIYTHDYVFWCGDFNYRIDLPNDEVKALIASENWSALQTHDQLNVQRQAGNIWRGFNEGKINFAPTYKYDMFSDEYDSSDKNRCPAWTDRILWKRRPMLNSEDPEADPNWSAGELLLYTRAELRASDHRPVLALFDIPVLVVNETEKNAVFKDVLSHIGPPDGTIIVAKQGGGEIDDETVDKLVAEFTEVGDVIVVRFVGEEMWLIYQNGAAAVEALQYNNKEVGGCRISVRLRTEDWQTEIQKELSLSALNTGALYNAFSDSLLGEDFTMPVVEGLDGIDDVGDDGMMDDGLQMPLDPFASLTGSPNTSGRNTPVMGDDGGGEAHSGVPARPSPPPGGPPGRPSPPPSRPSPPPSRPTGPSGTGNAGMLVPESAPVLRASPSPEMARKAPPQRPSAPPAKPPPPQRPSGGPNKPAPPSSQPAPAAQTTTASREAPKIRQPLRPPPSNKGKRQPRISSIGLPTNVMHHGTKSVQEAQALIERLMGAEGAEDSSPFLPPPLLPGINPQPALQPIPSVQASAPPSSLAPNPTPMPRSRTAQDMTATTGGTESASAPPKPMPRFRSMENISGSQDGNGGAEGSTSPPLESPPPQPRPRPAPRREAQSVMMGNGPAPPPPPPRPASEIGSSSQGVPSSLPSRPLDSEAPQPAVNLLDEPLPQDDSTYDPFDVSSVPISFLSRQAPPVPQRTSASQEVPASIDDEKLLVEEPSSEPPPCPEMSPPPSPPPMECPKEPPPPPPRVDSSTALAEGEPAFDAPPNLFMASAPPVPARPQPAVPVATRGPPPIPSRPEGGPPPVPRRTDLT